MEGHLLSDWLSLRGQDTSASIVQTAHTWLDIGAYEDLQLIQIGRAHV